MNELLIERLKAGISDIKDQHAEEGLSGAEQSLVDAAEDAITALSDRPSPDAAQGSPKVTTMADLLAIRGSSQMQDRQNYSRMEYPILESQPAAQGSEHGGGMPMEFPDIPDDGTLRLWTKDSRCECVGQTLAEAESKFAKFIAQRAIAWDRQNRASQPVQEAAEPDPVLCRSLAEDVVQSLSDSEPSTRSEDGMELLKGTPCESMFVLDGDDIRNAVEIAISNAIYDKVLFTLPPVAESVADEAQLERLLDSLIGAAFEGKCDKEAEALRTFFKQSLSHSSKGDEHGK